MEEIVRELRKPVEDAVGSKVEQRGTEIDVLERRNTNVATQGDEGQEGGSRSR